MKAVRRKAIAVCVVAMVVSGEARALGAVFQFRGVLVHGQCQLGAAGQVRCPPQSELLAPQVERVAVAGGTLLIVTHP